MHNRRTSLRVLVVIAFILTTGVPTRLAAENVDPDNDASQYAWAENIGWINAEPANCGGCGVQVSDFALTGWMWGENVGWISLSCQNRSTCATVNYGIANDGHGNLHGYAWAENVGWINFAPSTSSVVINPTTGVFSGNVWAENVGWIAISDTNPVAYGIKTDWCLSVAAAPSGVTTGLSANRLGSDIQLNWTAASGADWSEIVRGDLSALRDGNGDYSAATDGCAGDNVVAMAATVSSTPEPIAGEGYWYLVGGVNCKGKGTFDSGGVEQAGSRDTEIAASGADCP